MREYLQGRTPLALGRLSCAHLAMTVDLQLGVLAAGLGPGGFCPESASRGDRGDFAGYLSNRSSQVFRGTSDQLAAVRRFVRSAFADHPTLEDAVLVASELAANAIAHTRSGLGGGIFTVHLGMVSRKSVCILVADEGGPTEPKVQHAGSDAESGRGLDLVTAVSSIFIPAGDGDTRNVLVVITAGLEDKDGSDDGRSDDSRLHARSEEPHV